MAWRPRTWLAAHAAAIVLAADAPELQCSFGPGCRSTQREDPVKSEPYYYWPFFHGRPESPRVSPYVGPQNFNKSLAWTWRHPKGRYHSLVQGITCIDDKLNLYLGTTEQIYKLSSDGQEMWSWTTPGSHLSDTPAIMDGLVFAMYGKHVNGSQYEKVHMVALDMETGREVWTQACSEDKSEEDGAFVIAWQGMLYAGMARDHMGGTMQVAAMNATNGETKWWFAPDVGLSKFSPVFTENGTMIFQDENGGVYHLQCTTGRLLWWSGYGLDKDGHSWTDGGIMRGRNGIVYAVHADGFMDKLSNAQPGDLSAYRESDGELLWRHHVGHPPNSWPVVARLKQGERPALIFPYGAQGRVVPALELHKWVPVQVKKLINLIGLWLGERSYIMWKYFFRRWMNVSFPIDFQFTNGVHALDADTGAIRWDWKYVWRYPHVRGGERIRERNEAISEGYLKGQTGLPNSWSAPTVDAEGTIYIGGQNGILYAIREIDGAPVVIDSFDAGMAFYSPGAAIAPGMMAIASMDTLYVFKT